ncbi:hypothetical protein AN216_20700, partial [Streptomyces oceani]
DAGAADAVLAPAPGGPPAPRTVRAAYGNAVSYRSRNAGHGEGEGPLSSPGTVRPSRDHSRSSAS